MRRAGRNIASSWCAEFIFALNLSVFVLFYFFYLLDNLTTKLEVMQYISKHSTEFILKCVKEGWLLI